MQFGFFIWARAEKREENKINQRKENELESERVFLSGGSERSHLTSLRKTPKTTHTRSRAAETDWSCCFHWFKHQLFISSPGGGAEPPVTIDSKQRWTTHLHFFPLCRNDETSERLCLVSDLRLLLWKPSPWRPSLFICDHDWSLWWHSSTTFTNVCDAANGKFSLILLNMFYSRCQNKLPTLMLTESEACQTNH